MAANKTLQNETVGLIAESFYQNALAPYSKALVDSTFKPYENQFPLFSVSTEISKAVKDGAKEFTTQAVLSILPPLCGAEHILAEGSGHIAKRVVKKVIG